MQRIKTYKVVVADTGKTYYFDTTSKKMAKLMMQLDYPKSWGKQLSISICKSNVNT